jgi:hypothetical protein
MGAVVGTSTDCGRVLSVIYQIADRQDARAAANPLETLKKRSGPLMKTHTGKTILLSSLALFVLSSTLAQEAPAGGGKATITVTAIGRKDTAPPAISKDDVQLTVGNERKQIAGWAKGDALALGILIDDSLDTTVAGQWNDLRDFIMAQGPNTAVAVGYASNRTTMIAQDFTTDHAAAAKALRIPRGIIGASSPYLSVINWLRRWPTNTGRGSILLISSGIDFFRGSFGPFYPDVDPAISNAQRANVNLWSIYAPSAGHRNRNFFLVNMAQNNLSKMTYEAGGETYFLGTAAPVSFKPYLDEIQMHLGNQYLLTFTGDGGSRGRLVRVQLRTELPDVEFSHANMAFIGPAK